MIFTSPPNIDARTKRNIKGHKGQSIRFYFLWHSSLNIALFLAVHTSKKHFRSLPRLRLTHNMVLVVIKEGLARLWACIDYFSPSKYPVISFSFAGHFSWFLFMMNASLYFYTLMCTHNKNTVIYRFYLYEQVKSIK